MKLFDFRKLERDGYYRENSNVYLHDALSTIEWLEENNGKTKNQ